MTRLSLHTKVLFVNSIGMRAPLPGRSTQSGFRIWRKIKSLFKGLRKPLPDFPDFYVFTPLIIPAYSTPWLRRINYVSIRLQIRMALLVLRMKNPIVFETIPTANEVAKHLPLSIEVINRVDKMSAFGESDQTYIASLESEQIARAQRTFYTSQVLLEEEIPLHKGKGKFLDHGVDLDRFRISIESTLPDELSEINTPILGFFGGIDDYVIDLSLLKRTAQEFPQCTLVLIGEATCNISMLTELPNVKYLGFKSVEDVARLGAYFDVALLPRLNDDWTKYTNPIKIKEYLALGLDIVTMDIPEVRRYAPDVKIAHSHDEFIALIRQSIEVKETPGLKEHRRKLVEADTWDQRCKEIIADMKELLICAE